MDPELREWAEAFGVDPELLNEAARIGAGALGARIAPEIATALAFAQAGKAEEAAAALVRVLARLPGYDAVDPASAVVYRAGVKQ